jgi:hypothetical protein
MSNFKEILTHDSNSAVTENGQVCYNDTNNPLLDFYYRATRLTNRYTKEMFLNDFKLAYTFDKSSAIVLLFNLRDVREGKGERDIFRYAMEFLKTFDKEMYLKVISLVPEYGRWDDLVYLQEYQAIVNQLKQDSVNLVSNKDISLCAKWAPSHSSKKHKEEVKGILRAFNITQRQYRVILSSLRNKIGIVEKALTNKQYSDIDYGKIPSQAMQKYKKAFYRTNEEGFKAYIASLASADKKEATKVNINTLYPHNLVTKSYSSVEEGALLEAQWETLKKKYSKYGLDKVLVAADISGSMTGLPMQVSVGLAMFISSLQESPHFKDMVCLFSECGRFLDLKFKNPYDNYQNVINRSSSLNTNISSVFSTLLSLAKSNSIPKSEMPETVVIISDMQFDHCSDDKMMTAINKMYHSEGYDMPKLVFWNVATAIGTPSYDNEKGVLLLSGYSPNILKQVFNIKDWSPAKIIEVLVNSDRYKPVLERIS